MIGLLKSRFSVVHNSTFFQTHSERYGIIVKANPGEEYCTDVL